MRILIAKELGFIDKYNWKSECDFLKAHTLLMKYFEDDNGYYRNHGEGVKRGNEVILNDLKEEKFHSKEQVEELKSLGCELILGKEDISLIDKSLDYLIKNPGVKIDHPYVLKAEELGIPVINEVELCYQLMRKDITLIGITGTNGKTTTTTLTHLILKEAFKERVHLAGNIGYPLCSVIDKIKKDDILVMEVSCQQSENIVDFHPNIALITNYSQAHIDFFKTYDNYKKVKSKMFYNQSGNDIAILNKDNKEVIDKERILLEKLLSDDNIKIISADTNFKALLLYLFEKKSGIVAAPKCFVMVLVLLPKITHAAKLPKSAFAIPIQKADIPKLHPNCPE